MMGLGDNVVAGMLASDARRLDCVAPDGTGGPTEFKHPETHSNFNILETPCSLLPLWEKEPAP